MTVFAQRPIRLIRAFLPIHAAFFGVGGALILFSETIQRWISNYYGYNLIVPLGTTLLAISGGIAAFIYLQSGGSVAYSTQPDPEVSEMLGYLKEKVRVLDAEITKLRGVATKESSEEPLQEEDRARLLSAVVDKIGASAIEGIFKIESEKFREKLRDETGLSDLRTLSYSSIERLKREIEDLRRRSNLNLLIGMAITGGGLYLLWTTVAIVDASALLKSLASEDSESNAKFIKNLVLPLVPRLSLVIFVEIFAYFFLKLYRANLDEIRFFQNELTNVETKLIAVEFSYIAKNPESLKTALESLSNTERNFILEKGQTTVDLERAKSESELTRNMLRALPEIFKKSDSK